MMQQLQISNKFVGSGCYAKVFETDDPDIVVKTYRYDTSYDLFLKYISTRGGVDKHLPLIHSVEHNEDEDITEVYMEKLYKLPSNHPAVRLYFKSTGRWSNVNGWMGHSKSLDESLEALQEKTEELGYSVPMDIHEDNVMQRADGTLVITDPWA
jgi:3-deoxy-D-manno-octulosonic acid (KDO) 8-phosphate synthase